MEVGKFYNIWYKDDTGKSRNRGFEFLGYSDIDVKFKNVMTGRIETLFIGTFQKYRGRTKEFNTKQELLDELKGMEARKQRWKERQ